ncbi:hypothetical protein CVO96_18390 [Deinococcus koreensis]|uniref:Peptidase C39-like domain-containing protein n=1 Tax=Deinococcus koreensis TaxID=2054903 RepID=A0A2K3UTN2_9DEIO|nr:hypothetical protein CVO96_18390 [Deinococcus koreensis]
MLALGLLLAACSGTGTGPSPAPPAPAPATTPGPGEVRQTLRALAGGTVVHPAGARLVVPAGALAKDAAVSLREAPSDLPGEGFQAAGRRFVVDVQGGELKPGALLELDARGQDLVLLTTAPDGTRRLRRADVRQGVARIPLQEEASLRAPGAQSYELVRVPAQDVAAPTTILNVPYYWQDNLPWCVPTSLAMVMNQYENLQGTVANWQLAGADHQASDEGNRYLEILDSLGVNKALYDYLSWDADLIPSAPFTNYLKFMINTTGRAPGLSSTTTSHAFVGVGASNTHVWLHDPSGAFSGTASVAQKLSWEEFRAVAIDATRSNELRTLIFHKNPKPPALRRGSVVLEEGAGGSLSYHRGGQVRANWQWDGSFWTNGYIWDDPTGTLPQDGTYGNRFPRTGGTGAVKKLDGHFSYKARVANVTGQARNYQLFVFLESPLGPLQSRMYALNLPAYSWKNNVVNDVLDNFNITQDGTYSIRFELLEGGDFVDVKTVKFAVGDGPLAIP